MPGDLKEARSVRQTADWVSAKARYAPELRCRKVGLK